jgi:hypothetical protein
MSTNLPAPKALAPTIAAIQAIGVTVTTRALPTPAGKPPLLSHAVDVLWVGLDASGANVTPTPQATRLGAEASVRVAGAPLEGRLSAAEPEVVAVLSAPPSPALTRAQTAAGLGLRGRVAAATAAAAAKATTTKTG